MADPTPLMQDEEAASGPIITGMDNDAAPASKGGAQKRTVLGLIMTCLVRSSWARGNFA